MTHSARRVFCKSTLTRSAFEKESSFSKRDRKKAALSYSDNWEFLDWSDRDRESKFAKIDSELGKYNYKNTIIPVLLLSGF